MCLDSPQFDNINVVVEELNIEDDGKILYKQLKICDDVSDDEGYKVVSYQKSKYNNSNFVSENVVCGQSFCGFENALVFMLNYFKNCVKVEDKDEEKLVGHIE